MELYTTGPERKRREGERETGGRGRCNMRASDSEAILVMLRLSLKLRRSDGRLLLPVQTKERLMRT